MRKSFHTRLMGTILACLLAGASMPLMAAVYKCERNGLVVYSDSPCGKNQQVLKKPQLTVVPTFMPPSTQEKQSLSTNSVLEWLGLDTHGGLIAALLFSIPLSIIFIFFLTRKSKK